MTMTESDTKRIRVVVVDDEPAACRILERLISENPEFELTDVCYDSAIAVDSILSLSPDLVFLDIQMPEMNGFEVVKAIEQKPLPVVIFVTAYDQYALQAFEVHALDYLLKPFDNTRFNETLTRARDVIRQKQENVFSQRLRALMKTYGNAEAPRALERIAVKSSGWVQFVEVEDIDWIEAADQYSLLHTASESHLVRVGMNHLDAHLPAQKFLRIHRSAIVNLSRVRELNNDENRDCSILLKNGKYLKVSRARKSQVQDALLKCVVVVA